MSSAQQLASIAALPADSHDVYIAYFQYHATWIKWSISQAAGKSMSLSQQTTTLANLIHVDPKEITVVHAVALKVSQGVSQLSAQQARLGSLTKHQRDQFEIRREQIILSGVRDLQRHLTPVSWQGLHQYINNDFRVQGSALPGLPIGTVLP